MERALVQQHKVRINVTKREKNGEIEGKDRKRVNIQ